MPLVNLVIVLMVGMSSTFLGVGISRFAFTPLMPMISSAGWFSVTEVNYLGSINLLGYLIGALSAHRLSLKLGTPILLMAAALMVSSSYLLCFWPISYTWVAVWRLFAGISGGWLMVVGPAFTLKHTPKRRRNLVMTMIFMGIGCGVIFSSILIPLLLNFSFSMTWLAIGGLSLCVAVTMSYGIRQLSSLSSLTSLSLPSPPSMAFSFSTVWLVIMAYGLDAAGFIPHTIYWVDYLVRELNFTSQQAFWLWAAFGGGCITGPLVAHVLVSRLSWHGALIVAYSLKTLAIFLPVITDKPLLLFCSAFLVGVMTPGIVALTAGRVAELVGTSQNQYYWGIATAGFALLQALSGWAMSFYYQQVGEYTPLFMAATVLMFFGLLCLLTSQNPFQQRVRR